jgi:hypothetical protein
LSGLLMVLAGLLVEAGRSFTYPGEGYVVDITAAPYGADRTGAADISAILVQASLDARARAVPLMVYFPDGIYRIEAPVVLADRQEGGGFIMLQGESREGVMLRVPAQAPAFADGENARAVISYFEGTWTNNGFTNVFENFTIEVGAGNPGATGLRFQGNNTTHLRSVTIRSLDPDGAGAIGLDLSPSISAPALAEDFSVEGFRVGIALDLETTGAQTWTLKDFTLSGQLEAGIRTHRKPVAIQNMTSVNTVPVIDGLFRDGNVVVIGADWRVPAGARVAGPAVVGRGDLFYLRDVVVSGYDALIDDNGTVVPATGSPQEYRNGPAYKLWRDSVEGFLKLPATPFPEVPFDPPESWAVVDPTLQDDDTEALRAAMFSGAETLYLKPTGQFKVDGTIDIGPNVRRITSNFAEIVQNVPLSFSGGPVFRLGRSHHAAVVVERLAADWQQNLTEYFIHNASNADLILQDIFWNSGALYRNDPAGGRLFVKNAHCVPGGQQFRPDYPGWIITHQETVAYQFNPEMTLPMLTVDGGSFRVLGFKFGEQQGPVVVARNRARVEMLGGVMNVTHGVPMEPQDLPIFEVADAAVTATLIERAKERLGPPNWDFRHTWIARETRGPDTRVLPTSDPLILHRDTLSNAGPGQGGALVPLFTSWQPANGASAAPAVELYASRRPTLSGGAVLLAWITDADTPAAAVATHWEAVSGPGWVDFEEPSAAETRASFSRAGDYVLALVADDGDNRVRTTLNLTVEPTDLSLVPERRGFIRLVDTPPRDGVGDLAIEALFLQTGDLADGSDVRVQLEQSIDAFIGLESRLAAASLALTPKAVADPLPVSVFGLENNLFGRVSTSEFASPGDLLGEIDPSELATGLPVEIDVTEYVRERLSAGHPYAGFGLRSEPDDNGVHNHVEWEPTWAADPAVRPQLRLFFTDGENPSIWDQAIDFGDGTLRTDWIGLVDLLPNGFFRSHAWMRLLFLTETGADGFWLWSGDIGWLWSSPRIWPHLYNANRQAWQYAEGTGSGVWFYDYLENRWIGG